MGGQGTARGQQDVEVLTGGVGHRLARAVEHVGQGGQVEGQGVDQGHPVGPGDLDEGQVRHVRPLGVELGVEGVVLLAQEGFDQRGQAGWVVDHGRDVGRRAHGRHRPVAPVGVAGPVNAGDDDEDMDKREMRGPRLRLRPTRGERALLRRRATPEGSGTVTRLLARLSRPISSSAGSTRRGG